MTNNEFNAWVQRMRRLQRRIDANLQKIRAESKEEWLKIQELQRTTAELLRKVHGDV